MFTTVACTHKKPTYFYHVLLIEFTQDAPINQMTDEILQFKQIPSVIDVAFGKIKEHQRNTITNFTHCLILKFKDKQGLEAYLKAPYHVKIYEKHKSHIAAIQTADFNAISLTE
jgi:hypothetical protein